MFTGFQVHGMSSPMSWEQHTLSLRGTASSPECARVLWGALTPQQLHLGLRMSRASPIQGQASGRTRDTRPVLRWLERGVLIFIRKIQKPGAPGHHPGPIRSWSAWVWSWYGGGQSQGTRLPGPDEIFELPKVTGVEASSSFSIFKYLS